MGMAGTGKTFLALAAALEQVLESGRYRRVSVYRPLIAVGRQEVGYLPGDLSDKLAPWMAAGYDNLYALFADRGPGETRGPAPWPRWRPLSSRVSDAQFRHVVGLFDSPAPDERVEGKRESQRDHHRGNPGRFCRRPARQQLFDKPPRTGIRTESSKPISSNHRAESTISDSTADTATRTAPIAHIGTLATTVSMDVEALER